MAGLYTTIETKKQDPIFKDIYEWRAPERLWTPKTRAWYVTYSFFFISIIFIAALLQEYIFIVAIITFSFLWFIQGSTPPNIVKYQITSLGIRAYEKLYRWKEIKHFWFSEKDEVYFLNIDLDNEENPRIEKRISLIINDNADIEIFNILIKNIDYGDTQEVNFNILTQIITGKHIDIAKYLSSKNTIYTSTPTSK
jgi:hypothetical protein